MASLNHKTDFDRVQNAPDNLHKFSYISPQEFETFIKHVMRERKKKKYEDKWNRYLQMKQVRESKNFQETSSFSALENTFMQSKAVANGSIGYESFKCETDCGHLNSSQPQASCCCMCHTAKVHPEVSPATDDNRSQIRVEKPEEPHVEENHKEKISLECQSSIKRIEQLRAKMINVIQTLRTLINQPGVLLEEEDNTRNKQRSIEFAARFKRNYHYQISCQLNELRKLVGADVSKKEKTAQKFIAIHQVGLQALQAAEKHMASTSHDGSFLWLKEFLSSVCDLSVLLARFTDKTEDSDQLDDLEKCCIQFIDSIQELVIKKEDEVKRKKKKSKLKSVNAAAQDNLWMYRSHKTWKEKAAEMARARFSKRNRKRGEGEEAESRSPDKSKVEKQLDLKMEIKQREGSSLRKSTRNVTEEQVRTMMEIVPESSDSDCEEEKEKDVTPTGESLPLPNKTNNDANNQKKNEYEEKNVLTVKAPKSSNVKLLILKSEKDTESPENNPSARKNAANPLAWNTHLRRYKNAITEYKSSCEWYKPKVAESVEMISSSIIEEVLLEVYREINFPLIFEKIIQSELQEHE